MKKVTVTTIMLLLIFMGCAFAGSNHQGMEVSHGGPDRLGDSNYDFSYSSISVFNKHTINENWNLNLHGTFGYLRWDSSDYRSDEDTFAIEAQLIIYRKLYKNLSLGFGGGFSTLTDPKNLPDLGNSGLYGTFTGRLNLKVNKNYGIEASADHISDAFQECDDGDSGKDFLTLKIYYMFN